MSKQEEDSSPLSGCEEFAVQTQSVVTSETNLLYVRDGEDWTFR